MSQYQGYWQAMLNILQTTHISSITHSKQRTWIKGACLNEPKYDSRCNARIQKVVNVTMNIQLRSKLPYIVQFAPSVNNAWLYLLESNKWAST